jgi:hypothetical protein
MKVRDIDFVEDELISGIERFQAESVQFCSELQSKALGAAAARAAKEEALKSGMVGVAPVKKAPITTPLSPKISKGRPPKMPEPEKISQAFFANEVPDYLESNNLQSISKMRQDELEQQRIKTKAKYDEKHHFNFQEMRSGRDVEEVRREVEEERMKGLQFGSSFVNPVPDFTKIPAKVRLNAAAIYREESLFRKQQAKDAEVLKRYEEELRDPVEFLIWQKEMKEKDRKYQLDLIAQRKSDIRQSHIESHEAIMKQKDDNRIAADLQREQAEISQQQKDLDLELELLRNQSAVQTIMDIRDTRPKQAVERDIELRAEKGRLVRESIDTALQEKEERARVEEEIRAEKIRQSRADNIVCKKQAVIFDPTVIAGAGFLDEMSYTEMKIRIENEKAKAERCELDRRTRIIDEKDKKARDLEERAKTLMRVRQVKSDTNKALSIKKKEAEEREAEAREKEKHYAAMKLDDELRAKREVKRQESVLLAAEEERAKRHRLYLGAAADLLEEKREKDLLKGLERIQSASQRNAKEEAALREKSMAGDRLNRASLAKQTQSAKDAAASESSLAAIEEKKRAVKKLRDEVLLKRSMVLEGKEQHNATHARLVEHNPYAATISLESVALAQKKAASSNKINSLNRSGISKSHK